MKLKFFLLSILLLSIASATVTVENTPWVKGKPGICPFDLLQATATDIGKVTSTLLNPSSCISSCMKGAKQGHALIFVQLLNPNCLCVFKRLNVETGPVNKCSSLLTGGDYYFPRYATFVEVGPSQLEGDDLKVKSNYLLGSEFENFIQGVTRKNGGQHVSKLTASGWFSTKGNNPVGRVTERSTQDSHRARSGPKQSQTMEITVNMDSAATKISIFSLFFKPMANLYLRSKRRQSEYKIDDEITVTSNQLCGTIKGKGRVCHGYSYDYKTVTAREMFSAPQYISSSFYDMSGSSKNLLATMTLVNTDYVVLVPAQTIVHPSCDWAKELGGLSTLYAIPGLVNPGIGLLSTGLGFVAFFLSVRCKKKSSLQEFRNSSILENRLTFCNQTFASQEMLPFEDRDMCTRLLWSPNSWFSEKGEDEIAEHLLPTCNKIDDQEIGELIHVSGVNESKILGAKLLCEEISALINENIPQEDQSSSSTNAIIGSIFGGVTGLALLGSFVVYKRRSFSSTTTSASNPLFVAV